MLEAVLVGIAGSFNAFSLSLYNLKAYALTDLQIAERWGIHVLQLPYLNPAFGKLDAQINELVNQILERRPRLVGFSVYMWNLFVFEQVAARLKASPQAPLLAWGGPEIAREYVVQGKYDRLAADFLISGEGELTFRELLRTVAEGCPRLHDIPGLSFRNGDGTFQINEPRAPFKSITDIPSPYLNGYVDDDVLARRSVEANLETQRGCSLRCSYCIYHKDMAQIAYSAIDRVREEVLYVTRRGVKKIRFVDANFSSDLDFAKQVMRELIACRIESKLMFELIPGFIDEELASLFGEYRDLHPTNEITLGVGVQTINLAVLRKMRRGIRVDRFEQTFELLERYGIYAKIDLIIGLPGEDLASISRTLEYFLDRLRNSRAHLLCCHVMRGLPGTELLDIAREYEMVFSSKYEPHELIESPILPRQHMLLCLRRTGMIFRLVNHKGWASREFLTDAASQGTTIRDAFFQARERVGSSNVEMIDLLIDRLYPQLMQRGSNFAKEDFPNAESWWWSRAQFEISDRMLIDALSGVTDEDLTALRGRTMTAPSYRPSWVGRPLPVLQ